MHHVRRTKKCETSLRILVSCLCASCPAYQKMRDLLANIGVLAVHIMSSIQKNCETSLLILVFWLCTLRQAYQNMRELLAKIGVLVVCIMSSIPKNVRPPCEYWCFGCLHHVTRTKKCESSLIILMFLLCTSRQAYQNMRDLLANIGVLAVCIMSSVPNQARPPC